MKKLISIIVLLSILTACEKKFGISDYAGVPESSKSSEENGLLIARYFPNENEVLIDGEKYSIIDSWATYRFKTKENRTINKETYDFLFSLKNVKTGKLLSEKNSTLYLNKSVRNIGEDYGHSKGIGIESGLFSIGFLTNRKPISPNTIVIEFVNGTEKKRISFIKKASH